MSTYRVVQVVSAERMGDRPWISSADDSTFEAASHSIDGSGNLHLRDEHGAKTASFPAGVWISVAQRPDVVEVS